MSDDTQRGGVCPDCDQPADAPCGECGRPFDSWAIHYTTTVCATCGGVYQIEYRVCEQCDRRKRTDLWDDSTLTPAAGR